MKSDILKYLKCPDCASGELKIDIYSSMHDDISDGRITCLSCGGQHRIECGIANLLPSSFKETGQARFFRENADDYESRVADSSYYKALDHIAFLDWVNRELSAGMLALELGSGTGRQCIIMAQNRIRTIGIDISKNMLLLAKMKIERLMLGEYIDLIVADAEDPPVREDLFDACVCYGTLHHLDNPAKTITGASRRLKEGGLFFSLDPHDSPARFIFDALMKVCRLYEEKAGANPLISEETLKGWLSAAGIKSKTRLSTYIPPHLCYMLNVRANIRLLKATDLFFNRNSFLRRLGGAVIAEGIKT